MKKIFKKLFSVNRIDLISKYLNSSNSLILEIGVHRGDFSKELLKNFNPKKLVLVDPWLAFDEVEYENSFYGNKYKDGQKIQNEFYKEVMKIFESEILNKKVEIIRDISENFFNKNKSKFDLIYIDGNHLYDFVRSDISNSLECLSEDGIIVLDDYRLKGWWKDGVTKAVDFFIREKKICFLEKHNLFNYHHQCIIKKI